MNIFYTIKTLCNKNNITILKLEKQIKVSRGILYTWKKSSPNVEKVKKIAEYFNVSMDYLLNHQTEENDVVKIDNEKEFIQILKSSKSIQKDIENENIKLTKIF